MFKDPLGQNNLLTFLLNVFYLDRPIHLHVVFLFNHIITMRLSHVNLYLLARQRHYQYFKRYIV